MNKAAHSATFIARHLTAIATGAALAVSMGACHSVDDTRIPAMPVYIDLSNQGLWNSYGVSGFGDYRYFVMQQGYPFEPAGFPYNARSATGFGGVLLIEGMDPFSQQTSFPMAYDLSCPVEKSPAVKVAVDPRNYEAVCPVCGSRYDVTMGAGAPVAGPALDGSRKYGLRRYTCNPTSLGGYYIQQY